MALVCGLGVQGRHPPQPAKVVTKSVGSQTAATEGESVFGTGSGIKYFHKGISGISGRVNWN